jgi:hypothetical protein
MRTIATFDTPENAYLFRTFLESWGISATVLDEHLIQWFWVLQSGDRWSPGGSQ